MAVTVMNCSRCEIQISVLNTHHFDHVSKRSENTSKQLEYKGLPSSTNGLSFRIKIKNSVFRKKNTDFESH